MNRRAKSYRSEIIQFKCQSQDTHTQWTDYSTWTTKVFGKILAASSGRVRSGRCEAVAIVWVLSGGAWVNYVVHGTL